MKVLTLKLIYRYLVIVTLLLVTGFAVPIAEWLRLLLNHVPGKGEHLVGSIKLTSAREITV